MTIIQVGDEKLTRYPNKDFALLEEGYKECKKDGLVVASACDIARLRMQHPKVNSPAWKQLIGYTNSVVGVGKFEGKPTVVVAHANHPFKTAEAIIRFKSDLQRYVNGGFVLTDKEVGDIVNPHRDNKDPIRDVWFLQSNNQYDITNSNVLFSGDVEVNLEATKKTLLALFIGSKNEDDRIQFLYGFRNNNPRKSLGVYFEQRFDKDNMLFRPLWVGSNLLYGYVNYDEGCVFGVSSSAVGTAPNNGIEDLL